MEQLLRQQPAGEIWLPPGASVDEGRTHDSRAAFAVSRFSELELLPVERDWLWGGFLAPGLLTMLSGHAFAGKSMLLSGLLRALDEGQQFLGIETSASSGLLVTEEDRLDVLGRGRKFGLSKVRSEVVTREVTANLEWFELVRRSTEYALAQGHQLLVFDTFAGLAGLKDEQENDAGAISQRLRPLQQAAATGLAVLFLHHMNAQGHPRGSRAFQSIADISVRFTATHATGGVRLESVSRSLTATARLVRGKLIEAPDCWFYQPLTAPAGKSQDGDESQNGASGSRSGTDALLRAALASAGRDGLTYAELGRLPGLSGDKARKRLPKWEEAKLVDRHGAGTKSDPYRWFICGTDN